MQKELILKKHFLIIHIQRYAGLYNWIKTRGEGEGWMWEVGVGRAAESNGGKCGQL